MLSRSFFIESGWCIELMTSQPKSVATARLISGITMGPRNMLHLRSAHLGEIRRPFVYHPEKTARFLDQGQQAEQAGHSRQSRLQSYQYHNPYVWSYPIVCRCEI